MDHYLSFLEVLYLVTKRMRLRGASSIVKHLDAPQNSPILAPIADKLPEAAFMIDSLRMVAAGLSVEELTFYMDGYRHRLITHDKADLHLISLIFRTVWAIAHSSWDPVMCTEFGRATIPAAKSLSRKDWEMRCSGLELEQTKLNVNWGQMLNEIEDSQRGE